MTTTAHGRVFGGRATIVAHRGFGRSRDGGPVENTREALHAAVDAGLRWVELDVRRTADDHLVVRHFPTWSDGSFIAQLDLAEARKIGAVTLEELVEDLPTHVGVNLDVKTALEDALRTLDRTTIGILAPAARELMRTRRVLISSFDATAILYLRKHVPDIALAYLTWVSFPLRKAIPTARHLGADVVAPHWTSFGPNDQDRAPVFVTPSEAVTVAHEAGLEVMPWCPPLHATRELFSAGVDGVVVDEVAAAVHELTGIAD